VEGADGRRTQAEEGTTLSSPACVNGLDERKNISCNDNHRRLLTMTRTHDAEKVVLLGSNKLTLDLGRHHSIYTILQLHASQTSRLFGKQKPLLDLAYIANKGASIVTHSKPGHT